MNPPENLRSPNGLSPQTSMADLMAAWPQVIPLLLEKRMTCVGCYMARFDTLGDAAANYGMGLDKLLADLERVIEHTHLPEDT